jgi:hypothetical protein
MYSRRSTSIVLERAMRISTPVSMRASAVTGMMRYRSPSQKLSSGET